MTQTQRVHSRQSNKKLANLVLGKTLGTGTFATVRQAIHIPTSEQVAVKILHKKLIVDWRDKMNLSRQIRILKLLRHPNIGQLLQITQTQKKIYLVMEHVKGGELFNLIVKSPKQRLSQERASCFFQQLLGLVQYMGSLGVVHRDIKPQNILIGEDNNIKLIDYGLSNLFQKGQKLTTACGSPCYAAPQMFQKGGYDPSKVDLWSSGIVLYTMLVGYLPFQHENTKQVYRMVSQKRYDLPKHLSLQAQDLLKKLFQPNPANRLNINNILRHPFCQKYPQNTYKGLLPSQIFEVDFDIVAQMRLLGYQHFLQDIHNNSLNDNTLTYFLLKAKKMNKKGQKEFGAHFVLGSSVVRSKVLIKNQKTNPQKLPGIGRKYNSVQNINRNSIKQRGEARRNRYNQKLTPLQCRGTQSLHKVKLIVK